MALLMCPSTYDTRIRHLAVWPAAWLEPHFLPGQSHLRSSCKLVCYESAPSAICTSLMAAEALIVDVLHCVCAGFLRTSHIRQTAATAACLHCSMLSTHPGVQHSTLTSRTCRCYGSKSLPTS